MKRIVRTIIFVALIGCVLSSCMGGKRPSSPSRTYNDSTANNRNIQESNVNESIEIPKLITHKPEQIISHIGYTLSYNSETCLANWVAYELTSNEVQGIITSSRKFLRDPLISTKQAENDDYKHSGWDRGHMCPAADLKWCKQAIDESFYFTNICPQNPNLNGGDWKALEEKCRSVALDYGKLYIVCGAIVGNAINGTLGHNRVTIPDAFYKVLLVKTTNRYEAIGFYFENKAGNRKLSYYAKSIDEIEKITNIDFFPSLPNDIESVVESSYNLGVWNIK